MIAELENIPRPILFVEFRFVWIFVAIFTVHWILRTGRARRLWLLFCSHAFYGAFFIGNPVAFLSDVLAGRFAELPTGWWFPSLLWLSTVMDYVVGLGIESSRSERRRKLWLSGSLLVNLGVLGFFKYFGFFEQNVRATVEWLGLTPSWQPLQIFLPYGISFYTFQSLSYSLEVYRGRLRAERSFLDLAFFIAFFPQVVAGPIVRAYDFLPQTKNTIAWASIDVRGGLLLFLVGFFKKACVADGLARISDLYFAAPDRYDAFSAWVAALGYAGQIYCDFSGYSDMAIAVAGLLGYRLCRNFDFPYFSPNVAAFWRRWHMSLSSWLRDYLYISLGGSRGSRLFTHRNLMLTMLLGGLWHGASWTFVAWGAMHGLALVVHREWARWRGGRPGAAGIMKGLAVGSTFVWVVLAWVPFRATDVYLDRAEASDRGARRLVRTSAGFQDAADRALTYRFSSGATEEVASNTPLVDFDRATGRWTGIASDGSEISVHLHRSGFALTREVWRSLVLLEDQAQNRICSEAILLVLGALALVHGLAARGISEEVWRRMPDASFYLLLGAAWAGVITMKSVAYTPFIYFQF